MTSVDGTTGAEESPAEAIDHEGEAVALTGQQIETYLREVGAELEGRGHLGEILIVGGAFMALVLWARTTTKDADAVVTSEALPRAISRAKASSARHRRPWRGRAAGGTSSPVVTTIAPASPSSEPAGR